MVVDLDPNKISSSFDMHFVPNYHCQIQLYVAQHVEEIRVSVNIAISATM